MKTDKIREALAVLGDLVNVKMAEAALNELANAEEVLKTATSWNHDARSELRDTFAAAALPALIAKYDGQDGSIDSIPQGAYEYADAMLAAREGK